MEIGTNIKLIRSIKKIRQKELANVVGITNNYLSMIENNLRTPSFTLIQKLALALDTSLQALFSDRVNIK